MNNCYNRYGIDRRRNLPTTYVDIPKVVRETIKEIGYTRAKYGYDYETMAILTAIDEQSPDIAQGVDKALEYRDKDSEEEIEAGCR